MKIRIELLSAFAALVLILSACGPLAIRPTNTVETGPTESVTENRVEVEASRDGVFTLPAGGERRALLSPEQTLLTTGDGVDVDQQGRAILRFADLLTVQVLRDGELTLQTLATDEQSAVIIVLQNGGTLLNDFNAEKEIDRRFTVQTEFATITATGTRFLVAREAGSPLEWVIGLDAGETDLQITADGVTKPVPSGTARWVAPEGEPSAGVAAIMENVQDWVDKVQIGAPVQEVGEVVWNPADLIADTQPLTELPEPGQPFELNGVTMTLDPQGLFGSPGYRLEDCNADGVTDIGIEAGRLLMDFRGVAARVRALDVTALNRAQPGSGSLRALDPGRDEIGFQQIEAGPGQGQVLSLRAEQPYHYAELTLADGCFLGLSLTPPDESGAQGRPRPAVENLSEEPLPFVRIDQPEDGAPATQGFTLSGRTDAFTPGRLTLRVETIDGREIQTQRLDAVPSEADAGVATFQAQLSVDYALPAQVRLVVQKNALDELGALLAEDAVEVLPLLPQTLERPFQNGRLQALPVGPNGYGAIDIDGSLEDWGVLQEQTGAGWTSFDAIVFDDGCSNRYPLRQTEQPGDLSAQVLLAYDQNYLFVGFWVEDDGYVGYAGEDQRYFRGDAPQLLLDLDLAVDYWDEQVNADDVQIDLTPGQIGEEFFLDSRAALWQLDTLESREFTEALVAAAPTGRGYFLEAALPWKYLGLFPESGTRLGIAASVSDNDTPDQAVQECMISTAPNRDWKNPITWGTLLLAEPDL
jgi:hypothetical protein